MAITPTTWATYYINSGTSTPSSNGDVRAQIEMSATQNAQTNTSSVTVKLQYRNNLSYIATGSSSGTIKFYYSDQTGSSRSYTLKKTVTVPGQISNTGLHNAGTVTFDVPHNSDGTKSFGFKFVIAYDGKSQKGETSATLDTIELIPNFTSAPYVTSLTETSFVLKPGVIDKAGTQYYRFEGGSWNVLNSDVSFTGLSPGSSYTVQYKAISSTSGRETDVFTLPTVRTISYPTVATPPEFTIGNSVGVYINNPLNRTFDLYLYYHNGSTSTEIAKLTGRTENGTLTVTPNATTLYTTLGESGTEANYYAYIEGSQFTSTSGDSLYRINPTLCKPTVDTDTSSTYVTDGNPTTSAQTGGTKLIRGLSIPRIYVTFDKISAEDEQGNPIDTAATGKYKYVDGHEFETSYYDLTTSQIKSSYIVSVKNSRNISSDDYTLGAIIHPYFKPTVSATFFRPVQVGNQMEVTFTGQFFNGYFDEDEENPNTMNVKWYVSTTGEEGTYVSGGTFTQGTDYTVSNNNFSSTPNLSLTNPMQGSSGTWNYQQKYYFKLIVEDVLYPESSGNATQISEYVTIGQPIYDWYRYNGSNYFNVNGSYMQNGQPLESGKVDDVKVNGTSILANKIADLQTQGTYNASSNKIATMSDLPVLPTIDTSMSSSSTNPVQNKVIKAYADALGTIYDMGSQNGGHYIRFTNGLMICTKRISGSVTMNVAVEIGTWPAGRMDLGWQPVGFTELWSETCTISEGYGASVTMCNQGGICEETASHMGYVIVCRPSNGTASINANVISIGKWK